MSRNSRIGVALGAALAVLAAAWLFLGSPVPERLDAPPVASPADVAPVAAPNPGAVTRAPAPVAAAEEPAAETLVLTGQVVHADSSEPAAGIGVVLLSAPPYFIRYALLADHGWNQAAEPVTLCAPAVTDPAGKFRLLALASAPAGWLGLADPHLAPAAAVRADAAMAADAGVLRVVPAGVVEGVLRSPAGDALAGAEVRLEPAVDLGAMVQGFSLLRAGEVDTDAAGRFRFASVPAGVPLELTASPAGWVAARQPVTAVAGATVTVDLTPVAGARLTGRVTAAGAPVADAEVTVGDPTVRFDGTRLDTSSRSEVSVITGADGAFAADGLAPGRYNVRARAAGYVEARRFGIELPAGGAALAEPIELSPGVPITGRVVDDLGAPVAVANVGVFPPASFFPGTSTTLEPHEARSHGGCQVTAGAGGRFETPPLADGKYDLTARAPGHALGSTAGVRAGATGVEVKIARGGAIEGIVVSLVDGEPVCRFTVAATRPFDIGSLMKGDAFRPVPSRQVIERSGRFHLEGIAPGEWQIEVVAAGHARKRIEGIEVKSGATVRGVVCMLDPESAILGRVTARDTGLPVAGARITTRAGLDRIRPDPLDPGGGTRADALGRFALTGLAGGRYSLSAQAPGYAPTSLPALTLPDRQRIEGADIALVRGATIRGTVTKDGAPVAGAFVSCKPVTGFLPAMGSSDAEGRYVLDGLAAGNYVVTCLPGLTVDSADVTAGLLERMQNQEVRVGEGETVVVDFHGPQAGGVTLRGVVREGNEPLAGAMLSFMPVDGEDGIGSMRLVTAGDDGRFEAAGFAPGDWTVTVQATASFSDAARQSFDFSVPDVPEHFETFSLPATGIAGHVRDRRTLRPISGARVFVDAQDEGAVVDVFFRAAGSKRAAEVFADDAGNYRVRGLAPGRYEVGAGGQALFGLGGGNYARSEPRLLELAEDQLLEGVDFDLDPGGTIRGRVARKDGGAIQGASLFFHSGSDPDPSPFSGILTDETGAYLAEGLTTGSYVVVAKAGGYAPAVVAGVPCRPFEETTQDLILEQGGTLTVEVVDAGAAIGGAHVELIDATGADLAAFLTIDEILGDLGRSAAGTHALGPIAPGLYTARATAAGRSAVAEVTHGAGDQTVTLVLE